MPQLGVAGTEPGERQLNGPQTTGRPYTNLSQPKFEIDDTLMNARIPMRDGTELLADIYLPRGVERSPVLLAASPYPRQIQNSGAPMGFVEAGATDFFVPRGYGHVILNERGTCGSGGTYDFFGAQSRRDLYDAIEWIAERPWCDGNVGMVGISAFAMTQIAAAAEQPPHLRAIFPVALSADTYEAMWHGGLLSATFGLHWLRAVGLFAQLGDRMLRGAVVQLAGRILRNPRLHASFAHRNGESALRLLGIITRKDPVGTWAELIAATTVEHPMKDAFWHERDGLALASRIRVPVYLGCDWENVPLHLPSTFSTLRALAPDVPVRVALLGRFGLTWPWESLHIEALAWYDQWLKGRETGIMAGPPIRYVIPADTQPRWHAAAAWPPPDCAPVSFALRADGVLGTDEASPGTRSYTYRAGEFGRLMVKRGDALVWTTPPLEDDLWFAGPAGVTLDAASSGGDTAFIFALDDVAPNGRAVAVTAGWRRAALSEDATALGVVPAGEQRSYRIPLVDNARRFARGHRLRLTLRGDDSSGPEPMMSFRHAPVGISTRVTVASSSRLTLWLLPNEPAR